MKIVMGADPWGVELKDAVKEHLQGAGHEVADIGSTGPDNEIPYYDAAASAARLIQAGDAECGVLFCGTGMGMAIVANKFKGIYASVIESEFTARMCKAVNNANVLTMGSMVVTPYIAIRSVDAWLSTRHTEGLEEFEGFLKTALTEVAKIEATAMEE
ncbi:MAG: RpiB/LacA/LacB family sugar-phosphate isomerase [bacterium]|nr:RpiB/LacA/LacB family sugar-phosphate isomerase [bacterium]